MNPQPLTCKDCASAPMYCLLVCRAHDPRQEVDRLRAHLENIRDTCPGRPAILARAALGEARMVGLATTSARKDSDDGT